MAPIESLNSLYHGEPIRVLDAAPGKVPQRGVIVFDDIGIHATRINYRDNPELFTWLYGWAFKDNKKRWFFHNETRWFRLTDGMTVETVVGTPRLKMDESLYVDQDLFAGQNPITGEQSLKKIKRKKRDDSAKGIA